MHRFGSLLITFFTLSQVTSLCCYGLNIGKNTIKSAEAATPLDSNSMEPSTNCTENVPNATKSENENGKNLLNRALLRSRRSSKFLSHHKNRITLMLALFAFRRELVSLIRSYRIQPSSVLKLILILDVLRKFQTSRETVNDSLSSNGSSVSSNPMASILWELKNSNSYGGTYNPPVYQHFMFESLNDRYTKDTMALQKILDSSTLKTTVKNDSSVENSHMVRSKPFSSSSLPYLLKNNSKYNTENIIFVFELKADPQMTQLSQLRDTVSFLLSLAQNLPINNQSTVPKPTNNSSKINNTDLSIENTTARPLAKMEVVVLLESPGGEASPYGLAASQLQRLRRFSGTGSGKNNKIKLTICVDKIAASGGYMMACQASPSSLLAAPFGLVGSIGVVSQAVNFHSTLKNWGVKPIIFKAPGEGKAPIGALAEVTKEGMEVVQSMVESTHEAFKEVVLEGRGDIIRDKIDDVATGEIFMGKKALELGLIDRLITSDEYIEERVRSGMLVLKIHKYEKIKFSPLLGLIPTRSSPLGLIKHKLEQFLQFSLH